MLRNKSTIYLGLIVFNAMIATNSYAEVKWDVVADKSKFPPEGCKTTVTISLDMIECAPEKLAEYNLKFPPSLAGGQSGIIRAGEDIRGKLSRLKKDKDINILYSTKVTTYPANKVIVDNRQPLEYLTLEQKDGTALKKEIAYTGGLFEVKPTIAKDGKINLDYLFWVGELKGRFSNNKNIPEELGYPMMDSRTSQSSISLENGETIIMGGMVENSQTKSRTSAGDITNKGKKALIICLGVDINSN